MKGIIFNLLEEVMTNQFGEAAWDDLLEDAGQSGAYTSLGSYPDEELFALVAAASSSLDLSTDQVLRFLGEGALPLLALRYPFFFTPFDSTIDFLMTLNDVIHTEVRKLYPGAQAPDFSFDAPGERVLIVGYDSPRRLCSLAEGFIAASATHFGESVQLSQDECMMEGAARCLIRCQFDL